MFFKRGREKTNQSASVPVTVPAAMNGGGPAGAPVTADPLAPLAVDDLRRIVDPKSLGFETTAALTPIDTLIGQDRALKAIEFGTTMAAHDFNLFVLGPPSTGKRTAVKAHLKRKGRSGAHLNDWAYVHNFEEPNRPIALRMPCGRGRALRQHMVAAIDELRNGARTLFEGEEFQARRRAIDEEFRGTQETQLETLNQKAQAQNIAILRTPMGFTMAPMSEGKVVKPETFASLPEDLRKGVEKKIEALQKELEDILAQIPKADKQRRARLSQLIEDMARVAVREAMDDVKAAFADLPEVAKHLEAASRDLVRNIGAFLAQGEEEENQIVRQPVDSARDPRFRRYMVNLIVGDGAHAVTGDAASDAATADDMCLVAPVIEEQHPIHGNLVGRIEHVTAVGGPMGAVLTDFLLIKPGALHRANGGTLILDARQVLLSPFAWEALKRALWTRQIRIEQPAESMGLVSAQSLEPEPIPLDVKVVLIGDRELYYLLSQHDPDFRGLFKVQADFDDAIAYSKDNQRDYARLVASVAVEHKLKPISADAVARLIEEGSRLADDREKLSIEIGRIADIVREADYWRERAGRAVTERADVARAIDENVQRADRVRDRAQETIAREIIRIDTAGAKVGQINALSVLQIGGFAFGRPSRVTARVRLGNGRVTDIEREVNLGGPLHSKGVLILWGFLAARYAEERPLAMAATLVFEQSYGGVDGDSASSTELYALLSALADVPIRQSLAVTGSVNQLGEVQAIGGVNEKIEGFFDVCKGRGLTGEQGVMIPRANVQHLMLREDVVAAAKAGKFRIWAVDTIDQGIEILTGVRAGVRQADGSFEPGTINGRVEARLTAFAEKARALQKSGRDDGDGDARERGSSTPMMVALSRWLTGPTRKGDRS